MSWISHAEWAPGVTSTPDGSNITTDKHNTEEQAKGVCRMLERTGYGGQREHYPLRTWWSEEKGGKS